MSNPSPQSTHAADTTAPEFDAGAKPFSDPAADAASPGVVEDAEMTDMRLAVMDSGELATRAAGMAADAAGQLRSATRELQTSYRAQRTMSMVLLSVCGTLMLVAGGVFAALAWRLQDRVTQLDSMVLAVGKRVVGMDASMESVGAVQEALQAMLIKQDAITTLQTKIDGRLDEAIKSTQGMPELTAKQVDIKTQAMSQQVTAMDARLRAQAGALSTLSSQMKGLQGALGDTGAVRRELEAQARQQRERQNSEASANAAAAAAARKRDSMLQYPRALPADKP